MFWRKKITTKPDTDFFTPPPFHPYYLFDPARLSFCSQVPGRSRQRFRWRIPRLDGENERRGTTGTVRQRGRVSHGWRPNRRRSQQPGVRRRVTLRPRKRGGRNAVPSVHAGTVSARHTPGTAVRPTVAVRDAGPLRAAGPVRAATPVRAAGPVRATGPVRAAAPGPVPGHRRAPVAAYRPTTARVDTATVLGAVAGPDAYRPVTVRSVRGAHATQTVRGQAQRHRRLEQMRRSSRFRSIIISS